MEQEKSGFKQGVQNFTNMQYEMTKIKNRTSGVAMKILAGVFVLIAVLGFIFFSWKVGVAFLIFAGIVFLFSKLAKTANRFTEKSQKKFNEMMDKKK